MHSDEHAPKGPEHLAIIGGGISGLSAAYYALEKGVPPEQIHVYEGEKRLGGKIKTEILNGVPANKGAEFIDEDQNKMLDLCKALGVELKEAHDQDTLKFQRSNGQIIDEATFTKAYQPIAEQVIAYKKALKNPEVAAKLNHMSMKDFISELAQKEVEHQKESRGFFGRMWDTVTFKRYEVDPEILTIIQQAYASEVGQPAEKVNAFEFVGEASDELDAIFASGCGYRVEGGTEKIIEALHKKLADQGVHFHTDSKTTGISKDEHGKIHAHFENGQSAVADKVIMALPAYNLGEVKGLESLGLSGDAVKLIRETQYTNSIKFTVNLKPGITADNSNLYSAKAYQSWSSSPGQMTFLCETSDMAGMNISQFMRSRMEEYAKGQGKSAADMFDCFTADGRLNGEAMVVTSAPKAPCYASPKMGQALDLHKLGSSLDHLASQGVGIAGTYLPLRHPDDGSLGFGFMECGLESANRAVDAMLSKEQTNTHWQEYLHQRSASPEIGAQPTIH